MLVYGYDCASGAYYSAQGEHLVLRTPDGRWLTSESRLTEWTDGDPVALGAGRAQAAYALPFNWVRAALDDTSGRFTLSAKDGGGWTIFERWINLPGTPWEKEATREITLDERGRVTNVIEVGGKEYPPVSYEPGVPEPFCIADPMISGGWDLVSWEIDTKDPAAEFTPERVRERALRAGVRETLPTRMVLDPEKAARAQARRDRGERGMPPPEVVEIPEGALPPLEKPGRVSWPLLGTGVALVVAGVVAWRRLR